MSTKCAANVASYDVAATAGAAEMATIASSAREMRERSIWSCNFDARHSQGSDGRPEEANRMFTNL